MPVKVRRMAVVPDMTAAMTPKVKAKSVVLHQLDCTHPPDIGV